MLKPIFDKDVDFFSKKIILCAKGGDFKKQGSCLTFSLAGQLGQPKSSLAGPQ